MKKITLIGLLLWAAAAWGQETQSAGSLRFYQQALEQGKTVLAQGDFTRAASQFQAARDNVGNTFARREEAQEWIDSTQRAQIVALKRLNEDLVLAKEKSDRSAREAEASRLATLSAQLYREQNYADALALAYLGMQKVEGQPLPTIQQVFGDAGYQYFKKSIAVPGGRISRAAPAPDGQTLAVATDDGQLLWYATDGALLGQASAHPGPILFLVFSPDGARLASGGADGTVNIWGRPGELNATLSGHNGDVLNATWNSAGDRLLSCGRAGNALLWDVSSGRLIATLGPQAGPVYEAVFAGDYIATRAADKTVKYWDDSGKLLTTCGGTAYAYDLAVSPQQDALLMAFADGAQLYQTGSGQLVTLPHTNLVQQALFDPQGNYLLTLSRNDARLWDRAGRLLATCAHPDFVDLAAFAPDGQSFLTASRDGQLRLWDHQGQLLTGIALGSPIRSAAFSADGNTLLAATDLDAGLWNRKGEKLMTLNGHRGLLRGAAFVPGSGMVLTVGEDHMVILCPPPGELYRRLREHPVPLSAEKMRGYGGGILEK